MWRLFNHSLCARACSTLFLVYNTLLAFLGFHLQVRGIETVTTYDANTEEFIVNTPCESAQKYWIGGAANVRTYLSESKSVWCLVYVLSV